MKRITALWMICLLLASVLSASAQELLNTTVTDIQLGIDELTLQKGDRFIFNVRLQPEDLDITTISWTVLDPEIAEMDIAANTVTALSAGETWLFASGIDNQASAVCHLIVEGEAAKAAEPKALSEEALAVRALSDEDLAKIKDPGLSGLLELLRSVPENALAGTDSLQNTYKLLTDVVPGSTARVSEAAYALGAADAFPMEEIDLVTLQATVGQIAQLLKGNPDILAMNSDRPRFYAPDDSVPVSKGDAERVPLEGEAEALTAYKNLHDLGITGKGVTIAVIDSAFNTQHPELAGRVKAEYCTGTNDSGGGYEFWSPCGNEASTDAANAVFPGAFTHGTHVAGIAAGKHGIAPDADMVLIAVFSEYRVMVADQKACGGNNYVEGKNGEPNYCYRAGLLDSDELKGYKWLNDLVESGTKIAAVNMSYGGGKYAEVCDDIDKNPSKAKWFEKLSDNGVLPVAATGNELYDDGIFSPACISRTMSVGALVKSAEPAITYFSNHGALVDITAPGDDILSANYLYNYKHPEKLLPGDNTTDPYVIKSGTSMAAPMVTGAAALLKQLFPEAGQADLETLLKATPVTVEKIQRANAEHTALLDPTPTIRDYYTALRETAPATADWTKYIKPVLNFSAYEKLDPAPVIAETEGNKVTVSGLPETGTVSVSILDGDTVVEDIPVQSGSSVTTAIELTPGKTYTIRTVVIESGKISIALTPYRIIVPIRVTASADGTLVTANVEVADTDIKTVTVELQGVPGSAKQASVSIPEGQTSVTLDFAFEGLAEDTGYTVLAAGQKGDQTLSAQAVIQTGRDIEAEAEAAAPDTVVVLVDGSANVKSMTVTLKDLNGGESFSLTYPSADVPALDPLFPVVLTFNTLTPETTYNVNIDWTDKSDQSRKCAGFSVETPAWQNVFISAKAYGSGSQKIHVDVTIDPAVIDSLSALYVSALPVGRGNHASSDVTALVRNDEIDSDPIDQDEVLGVITPVKPENSVDLNVPDDGQYLLNILAMGTDNLVTDNDSLFAFSGVSAAGSQTQVQADENGGLTVTVQAQDPAKSVQVLVLGPDSEIERGPEDIPADGSPVEYSFVDLTAGEVYSVYVVLMDENGSILRTDLYHVSPPEPRRDDDDDDSILFYHLDWLTDDDRPLPGTGFPIEN